MDLLEWLGESFYPGGVGGVGSHDNRRSRTRLGAIFTGLLAGAVCLLPFIVLVRSGGFELARLGIALAIELVYLPLAYHLKPEPDMENIGLLGGLIDHPLRYSDDINRLLLFFAILLMPGRWVAIGLVDFARAFRRGGCGA